MSWPSCGSKGENCAKRGKFDRIRIWKVHLSLALDSKVVQQLLRSLRLGTVLWRYHVAPRLLPGSQRLAKGFLKCTCSTPSHGGGGRLKLNVDSVQSSREPQRVLHECGKQTKRAGLTI